MSEIPSYIQKLLSWQLDAARYGIAAMSQAQLAEYSLKNDEIDSFLSALQSGRAILMQPVESVS